MLVFASAVAFLAAGHVDVVQSQTENEWDWPTWGGPTRNWKTAEPLCPTRWNKNEPIVRWKASVGTGYTPVTVKNGLVYSSGNRRNVETIYCLSATSGKVLWKHSYRSKLYSKNHDGGPAAAITVDEGLLWSLGRDGDLLCLRADSGEVVWSIRLREQLGIPPPFYGYTSSPLVLGHQLIVDAGVVTSFDKTSGKLIWRTEDYGAGYSSPILAQIDKGKRILTFNKFGVVLLNIKDGSEFGKYPWKSESGNTLASFISHEGFVFVSSGYGVGCGLIQFTEGAKPKLIYKNTNMCSQFQSCILHKGRIIGFDGNIGDSTLKCLDFRTGEVKWEEQRLRDGSIILADGRLIMLTFDGEIIMGEINEHGIDELERIHEIGGRCWTPPTYCGGNLFIRNSKGQVVCLDADCR